MTRLILDWLSPCGLRPPSRPWRRFYHLGWLGGLIASLPLASLAGWYAWSAFADLDRYRRASGYATPIDIETFQVAMHDIVSRDLDRVLHPRPADVSRLRTLDLALPPASLSAVMSAEKNAGYMPGFVRVADNVLPVEVRRRGARPCHWLGPQKSLKLRALRGDLVFGSRVFSLINDAAPFGLWPYVALGVASDEGLLTPDVEAMRLRLNNVDLGVFRYEEQPDEGLLRRQHRMPGSIFSGDGDDGETESSTLGLFASRAGWKKVAWASDGEKEDFAPLEELLEGVRGATHLEFAGLAKEMIDLERYARLDALDVVFGSEERDYRGNHKLYLDPFTGKLEPIVWGLEQFAHEPAFNLVDHPLLVRLKLTPGYLALRNRFVYELLTGRAATAAVRAQIEQLVTELGPELAGDPHWDAYKLLPALSLFHRYLLRPMTLEKWNAVARAELAAYEQRSRFLLRELERSRPAAVATVVGARTVRVDVVVEGEAPYALRALEVDASRSRGTEVRADRDGDGRLDERRDPVLAMERRGAAFSLAGPYTQLLPGVRLIPRHDEPRRGTIRLVSEARAYTYFVRFGGRGPNRVRVMVENTVTGALSAFDLVPSQSGVASALPAAPPRAGLPAVTSVPAFVGGEQSPHPWAFPPPALDEAVTLGPGRVRMNTTRKFGPEQSVTIAPGTRVELGPEASLVFAGPLRAVGTQAQPIVITAADPGHPFGTVLILGPATRGARLEHVRIKNGKGARLGHLEAAGMLNIYDTTDVRLSSVVLDGAVGTNAMHATYVDGLEVADSSIVAPGSDGFDLEFVRGEIRDARVLDAGDDCIDLTGGELRVSGSMLHGCANNGMVVGEQGRLWAKDSLIARASIGVLAKNNARADISRLVLFANKTALEARRHEVRYAGESRIEATALYAVGCERLFKKAAGASIIAEGVLSRWPERDVLAHLRGDVLGLRSWQDLESGALERAVEVSRP